jgi:hypothetical protein
MSSGVLSPWAFFKSTLYKFCFGLGLATLSYYSFAGVKSWIDERHERAEKNPGVGFQEKINALTTAGSGSESAIQMTQFPMSLPQAIPLPSAGASPVQNPAGDLAVLPAGADGAPSVTATPDPALAAANEAAPNPEAGDVVPNGAMEMPPPYAIPYVYDPGLSGSESGEESGSSKKADSSDGASSANSPSSAGNESYYGASVPGIFSPQSSNNYVQSSQANSNQLQPSDLPFLTAGLQAVFSGGPVGVNSNGGQSTVHTSRWTPNEGLAPEVKFAIVGSNVNSLTFQVGVNLQSANGTYALHTGVGSVITVNARNEYRSAQLFRVFEFRLSNISVRAGEILRQVHVTLSFEAGSAANPVLGTDSMISFVRTQVSMVSSPWNFNSPSASTDPVVIADQVNYSMPIERLP